MKSLKNILIIGLSFYTSNVFAQDTTEMIKTFNKVMSFSVQPYVYYSTYTRINASPVLQPEDTLSMDGEFYKNQTNLYYSNRKEEMFLTDSFFVQVNHQRKSIWISKVELSTMDKMNILPLSNKDMQQLFQQKYIISQAKVNDETSRLKFTAKQGADSTVVLHITLEFAEKSFEPKLLQMKVTMKKAINDEQLEQLQNENSEIAKAVQVIDNEKYFIRDQTATVVFKSIDFTKQKAMQMPSWENKLEYNKENKTFSAKGVYSDYEITQTF